MMPNVTPPTKRNVSIVVTGGRDFSDEDFVFSRLDNLHGTVGIKRLAHGGASGADAIAARWAREHGVECVAYHADWRRLGPRAGPVRNADMLVREHPDMVIAFPGGRGTRDCMTTARHMGLVVVDLRISYPPPPAR
jgi:hypothetical protein